MGRVTEGGRKGENFNKGHAANIQKRKINNVYLAEQPAFQLGRYIIVIPMSSYLIVLLGI